MNNSKGIHIVSFVLVVIGGINWGLIGLFGFDLVNAILGSVPAVERIVYVLVGVAAVYLLATHKKDCHTCSSGGESKSPAGGSSI